ncbi:iron-containing redox enzyme family protein [uncultured Tateyamaria sp.]|uniref:iron-containing redox enzyme family protein n=1 Tax=uncultured Tateyamaria sp. TaxID=455651 RepID=UPI00260F38EE|nr:iron-containing redox enzyme family protein [uncultured Tateyamaria sp.]
MKTGSGIWRSVFAYSINPEVYLDCENILGLIPVCTQKVFDCENELASLKAFSTAASQKWLNVMPSPRAEKYRDFVSTVLLQTAPIAGAAGAALQGLSAPSVFEDPPNLELMNLLADDVGAGSAERGRFDAFRNIARFHEVTSVTGSLRELSDNRDIRDGCFCLASLIYAMSRRSDRFNFELIGFDLAWRSIGLLPVWSGLAAHDGRWSEMDLARGRGLALERGLDLAIFSKTVLNAVNQYPQKLSRIGYGIRLFSVLLEELNELVSSIIHSLSDPQLAMAILIQDRAREARVYHENFKLEGKLLSDWFRESRSDPIPLVRAIGRSKMVRPNAPERSLLIKDLIGPNGAMFRIFSQSDLDIIKSWIASLASADGKENGSEVVPPGVGFLQEHKNIASGNMDLGIQPTNIRSAYHILQGRALMPRTRDFAIQYCGFWLEQSQASVDKTDRSLPGTWRPGDLREWLLATHDRNASDFNADENIDIPSRDMVIDQTLQLAPLTLIDGAWLQGFTDTALATSRVGAPLFETYWDELGNGDWNINHPKIYREVLAAMDIELPPTGSRAFVEDLRLNDTSFRLPVYWLCLGKLPVSKRPEILGMNLAMELSGVGGTYRHAHRFLQHYGFPTIFVDLHNTIDNVSTGHSAWAADAIDAYMQSTQDFIDPKQSWARIRLGFESLEPIVDDPASLDFFRENSSRRFVPPSSADPIYHLPLQNSGTY